MATNTRPPKAKPPGFRPPGWTPSGGKAKSPGTTPFQNFTGPVGWKEGKVSSGAMSDWQNSPEGKFIMSQKGGGTYSNPFRDPGTMRYAAAQRRRFGSPRIRTGGQDPDDLSIFPARKGDKVKPKKVKSKKVKSKKSSSSYTKNYARGNIVRRPKRF